MAVVEFSGTLPVTSVVANLFPSQIVLKTYACDIFFDALQAGDAIEIIIYKKDIAGASEKVFDFFTVTGVQAAPDVYIPPMSTASYRVTARKVSGVDRSINWVRSEYT